jgi:hypothetical protein
MLIPSLTVHLVHEFLPTPLPPDVLRQHLESTICVRIAGPTNMRRDQDIRRCPERIVLGKGFRIGATQLANATRFQKPKKNLHVKSSTTDLLRLQRRNQRFLVDDLAPRNVGNISTARVTLVQEFELVGRKQVRCVFAARLSAACMVERNEQSAYVNGTPTTSRSISCFKKLCKSSLLVPLYHALGRLPSGSPVPGTMYPSSFFDSGVLRGDAVYAMTSIPIALATRATIRNQVSIQVC